VRRDQRRRIDVTVPAKRQGHDGIDVHRTRSLRPDEVTVIDGIPVTTVARTLVDLADVLSPAAFRRAVHEADYRRLHAPLVPIPGRKGAALVEAVAAERADPQLTRTALEHAFLALIRSADLPEPKVNHHIHLDDRLVERDFVWPELKLIVEVDGRRAHTTRRAFEEDRRTDAELHRRGWHTARFSERQVTRDPAWVSGVTTELTLARRGRTIVV
jgi:very-short-patch-repair endonuclease